MIDFSFSKAIDHAQSAKTHIAHAESLHSQAQGNQVPSNLYQEIKDQIKALEADRITIFNDAKNSFIYKIFYFFKFLSFNPLTKLDAEIEILKEDKNALKVNLLGKDNLSIILDEELSDEEDNI